MHRPPEARESDTKSGEQLVGLLESPSLSIAEAAADELALRREETIVAEGLLRGSLKTAGGRVRAVNILLRLGSKSTLARQVYRMCVKDRSARVQDCALFGIVHSMDTNALDELEPLILNNKAPARRELVDKAVRALKAKDPRMYAPHFHDRANVW